MPVIPPTGGRDFRLTSRWIGLPANQLAWKKWRRQIGRGVRKGSLDAAELLLQEANKVCPVDTETLRKSGKVHHEGRGFNFYAYVEYHAPYAVPVHENLFKRHAPPTHAKWLEWTAMRLRGQMGAAVRVAIRNELFKVRDALSPTVRPLGSVPI